MKLIVISMFILTFGIIGCEKIKQKIEPTQNVVTSVQVQSTAVKK